MFYFFDGGGFPFVRNVVRETSWLLGLPEDWPWVICRVVDIQYVGDSEDKYVHVWKSGCTGLYNQGVSRVCRCCL